MVEYEAERAATWAALLVGAEGSTMRPGRLVGVERSATRTGLLVRGFAGRRVKTSKSMGFLLPLLVFGVSFVRVPICFGLQISYKISLHGERAHDVLCVMCEHTRVHYKET